MKKKASPVGEAKLKKKLPTAVKQATKAAATTAEGQPFPTPCAREHDAMLDTHSIESLLSLQEVIEVSEVYRPSIKH